MLITEWCERGSIVAEGHRKPFTYREICMIVDQVAQALTWLHGQRVIHRAIRPKYILVRTRTGSSLEVCLSKFPFSTDIPACDDGADGSVSKYYSSEKGNLEAVKEPYMAPDAFTQFEDRRREHLRHPAAVDIWSLGVIALELATGSLPNVVYDDNREARSNPLQVRENTLPGISSSTKTR